MDTNSFGEKIKPFFWVEHSTSYSVCLNVGEYKNELFKTREDEGFEGNGYDWVSLSKVFLSERMKALSEIVKFDPEGSMFCAYSENKEALQNFIISFKEACEDDTLMQDLFSKDKLD